MRIHGDDDPLDQGVPRGERLWQPHAHLTCRTRSRQPALMETLRRLDVARGGVERAPKDCNTAERPLNRLGQPELDRTGRLGDHSSRSRQRLDQRRRRGQAHGKQDKHALQAKPADQALWRHDPPALTQAALTHHGGLPSHHPGSRTSRKAALLSLTRRVVNCQQ